jgi:hypothetical protein
MADNSKKETATGSKEYIKKDYFSSQSSDKLTGGQDQGTQQQQDSDFIPLSQSPSKCPSELARQNADGGVCM